MSSLATALGVLPPKEAAHNNERSAQALSLDPSRNWYDTGRFQLIEIETKNSPVIDFAINNVYLASMSTRSMRQPAIKQTLYPLEPPPTFKLKKMDSGDWGELSLAHPLKHKYKSPAFNDPSKLEFKMDEINLTS
eukprot:gene14337-20329_t